MWKFAAEHRPHFRVNAVLPGLILGQPLGSVHVNTAGSWLQQLYNGDMSTLGGLSVGE